MPEVKWIKLNVDMFDHHKIRYLRRLPEGNNVVLVWIMLLTLAGRCNAGGMIFLTENIAYTPKMLADELDFKENTVTMALSQLEMLNMIHMDEQFLVVSNWNKYQNLDRNIDMREYNRLAKQRSRGKKKSLTSSENCQEDVIDTSTGEVKNDVNDLSMTVNDCILDNSMTCQPCQNTEERRKKEEEEREEESKREEERETELEIQSIIHSADFDEVMHSILFDNPTPEEHENLLKHLEERKKQYYIPGKLGGGLVFLSNEQIDDLLEKLSLDEFDKYVDIIKDCELKGKHYKKKTHYTAILEMAAKDRRVSQ